MPLINHAGSGSSFAAIIQVTYNAGATCTCSNGSKTLTAPDTSGTATFKVTVKGTWVVTVTKDSASATKSVEVVSDGAIYSVEVFTFRIYGISRSRSVSTPEWARTDDAEGFTASAALGTQSGHSDFDTIYPWSEITRTTLSTGDVMVKIPKFWYRRYILNDIEYIQISDKSESGFDLHPAFTTSDFIYVGAYITSGSSTVTSASGASVTKAKTRSWHITNAGNKGAGWSIMSIEALSAIQMLILVEYATYDVQSAIGAGYTGQTFGTNSPIQTGSCDSIPGLTGRPSGTSNEVDVVWRGIEGLWGQVFEFLSNLTRVEASSGIRYSLNASGTTAAILEMYPTYNKYIVSLGLDESYPYAMLAEAVTQTGSSSTYTCDYADGDPVRGSDTTSIAYGGAATDGDKAGLFALSIGTADQYGSSQAGAHLYGSRLLYIPQ
jgi:hypothetical protein